METSHTLEALKSLDDGGVLIRCTCGWERRLEPPVFLEALSEVAALHIPPQESELDSWERLEMESRDHE